MAVEPSFFGSKNNQAVIIPSFPVHEVCPETSAPEREDGGPPSPSRFDRGVEDAISWDRRTARQYILPGYLRRKSFHSFQI